MKNNLRPSREIQGIVLLVVLGVLALLSVLAITFVSMTRLERSISRNYVDRTHAVLAAESGIEAAIAQLQAFSGGVLSPDEFKRMQYNPGDPSIPLAQAAQPSFKSEQPGPGGRSISGTISGTYIDNGDYYLLKVEDETAKLNLNDSNTLMDPDDELSGRLFHILENLGNALFADSQGPGIGAAVASAILSARDDLGGRFSSLREVTESVQALDVFSAREIDQLMSNLTLWSWRDPDVIKPNPRERSYTDPAALNYIDPDTKDEMSDPSTGYGIPFMRWAEVQSRDYKLEPRSLVNINTASVALIEAMLTGIEGWTLLEGPSEIYDSSNRYGPSGERTKKKSNTNYRYEQTSRSEICELLRAGGPNAGGSMWAFPDACLYNGTSVTWGPGISEDLPYARLRRTAITSEMAGWLAHDLYERIHGTDPNPVDNWREFESYLDSVAERARDESVSELTYTDVFKNTETPGQVDANGFTRDWGYDRTGDFDYFNQFHIDVILANLDPNTMSNDFNPDQCVMRLTDKADLEVYTTEACFEPTGVFGIESQGTVTSSTGEVLARVQANCLVQLFGFKRLTTQKDLFGADQVSNLTERFGDNQSAFRTNWETMTITYPEPVKGSIGAPEFDHINNAIFDGRVGLSPIKHDVLQDRASLWTYYESSFDAYDPGVVQRQSYPVDPSLYQNRYSSVKEEFSDGLLMGTDAPGQLYPDGAFSEAWSTIVYPALGHISPQEEYEDSLTTSRGAWLMTVKPNFMPEHSNRVRQFLQMGQGNRRVVTGETQITCTYFPHRLSIILPQNRVNFAWVQYNPWNYEWLCTRSFVFGFGHDNSDSGGIFSETVAEKGVNLANTMQYRFEGHRWNILSGSWIFKQTTEGMWINGGDAFFQLQINGKPLDWAREQVSRYGGLYGTPGATLLRLQEPGETFIMPLKLGGWARRMGGTTTDMYNLDQSADSTYGEFMLMTDPEDNLLEYAAEWGAACFLTNETEPLYYVTPPIDLGAKDSKPVAVRSISWTGRWPDEVNSLDVNTDDQTDKPDPAWSNEEEFSRPDWMTTDPADWDLFTVDIMTDVGDSNAEWLYQEIMGRTPPDTSLSYSGGAVPIDSNGSLLPTSAPVQLRFYFNVDEDQPHPVRESPYLDDITITWYPPGGAKILWYQMR
ncbi:PilX N-terminal domain-containing pilus assembly protein [Planctomycetota bacterium]